MSDDKEKIVQVLMYTESPTEPPLIGLSNQGRTYEMIGFWEDGKPVGCEWKPFIEPLAQEKETTEEDIIKWFNNKYVLSGRMEAVEHTGFDVCRFIAEFINERR